MGQHGSTSKLDAHFHLQKVKLGEGAYGTVWRAVDRKTGQLVAVKQVDKSFLVAGGIVDQRAAIEREIKLLRELPHVNIVRFYGIFEDFSRVSIVLEYCDSGDFGDKLKERGLSATEPEAANWMKQMLSAIAFMHSRRVCHRDIKPDNFLVSGAETLKLADLGLAVKIPDGHVLSERCGTPAFLAPEVIVLGRSSFAGNNSVSEGYGFPVDAWAAGVCMYLVMFGGRHPFQDEKGFMDERALIAGQLDWKEPSILGRIGLARARMSQEAQHLCKALVEPDQAKRLTADTALASCWFSRAMSNRSSDGARRTAGREAATSTTGLSSPDEPVMNRVQTAPAAPRTANAARPVVLGTKALQKLRPKVEDLRERLSVVTSPRGLAPRATSRP